jgi:hypothetical protein
MRKRKRIRIRIMMRIMIIDPYAGIVTARSDFSGEAVRATGEVASAPRAGEVSSVMVDG